MTSFSQCNFCRLRDLEKSAVILGEVITLNAGPLGTAVHRHPKGEAAAEANWVAWFMELPDRCECNEDVGVMGDKCELGNECGRLGCPNCQQ